MYKRALSILKNTFGYDSFRGQQGVIVEHIAKGCDALVLMPTGGGEVDLFSAACTPARRGGSCCFTAYCVNARSG